MKQSRILVVGSVNMDLFINVYKMPEAGETLVEDGGVAYIPGGRGASASTAFSRLGYETVFSAKLGADLHGQTLYQFLRDTRINTSFIKVDSDDPSGLSVIMKEGSGDRRTVVYPGANLNLTADNVEEAFSSSPDALYISLEPNAQTVISAMRGAMARDIPIFVDATPASADYPLEKLPECEIFSPNEDETEAFVGVRPVGADASLRAALALYKRVKCKYIVIKQGDRGAFIYDGKHYFMIPSIRVGKTVDTSAAGDAFGAAMTASYLHDKDIKKAVKLGIVAGAITVTRMGGLTSVPTEAEIVECLEKNPI